MTHQTPRTSKPVLTQQQTLHFISLIIVEVQHMMHQTPRNSKKVLVSQQKIQANEKAVGCKVSKKVIKVCVNAKMKNIC